MHLRYMEIHRFIALSVCAVLHEARVTAFDLNTTASFLLNVLDVSTTVAYHLRPKIEARYWLEIDGNALFWPFALQVVSLFGLSKASTYSSKLVALNLIWLSASKSSLIHEIWQLLLHEFVDLLHRFLKAVFRCAGNVKIEGRVLLG